MTSSQTLSSIWPLVSKSFKLSGLYKPLRIAVVFSVFAAICQVSSAMMLGTLFTSDLSASIVPSFTLWMVLFLGYYGLKFAADFFLIKSSFVLSSYWRSKILKTLVLPRYQYDFLFKPEDLAARATIDCEGIEGELSSILERLLLLCFSIIAVIIASYAFAGPIVFFLAVLCLIPLILPLKMARSIHTSYQSVAEDNSICSQRAKEFFDGWETITEYNAKAFSKNKMNLATEQHRLSGLKAAKKSVIATSFLTATSYLPLIAMIIFGGQYAITGGIELAVWIGLIKVSYDITIPLRNAGDEIIQLHSIRGRLDRIIHAASFTVHPVKSTRSLPSSPHTKLEVHNIRVQLRDHPHPLIWQNFMAQAGDIIGVSGPSGSGKSTLLRQLVKISDGNGWQTLPASSSENTEAIYWDPMLPTPTISAKAFINQISKTSTKERSPDENLIHKLPIFSSNSDFNTPLNAHPQGDWPFIQCQLAYSLIKKHPVVIFDETPSRLNDEHLELFFKFIRRFFTHTIVLIASHDQRTLELTDRTLHMTNNMLQEKSHKNVK